MAKNILDDIVDEIYAILAFIGLLYGGIVFTLCTVGPFLFSYSNLIRVIPVGIISGIIFFFSLRYYWRYFKKD